MKSTKKKTVPAGTSKQRMVIWLYWYIFHKLGRWLCWVDFDPEVIYHPVAKANEEYRKENNTGGDLIELVYINRNRTVSSGHWSKTYCQCRAEIVPRTIILKYLNDLVIVLKWFQTSTRRNEWLHGRKPTQPSSVFAKDGWWTLQRKKTWLKLEKTYGDRLKTVPKAYCMTQGHIP